MGYQIRLPAGAEGKQADAFRKLAGEVGYALNDLERRLSAAGTPAKGAVTAQALASGAVTAEALAPGSVTAEALDPGAVSAEALAPGSVTAEALASGAVAEEALGDTVIRCNPNLLDNWYFPNPINQRGGSSYAGYGYTIDRWYCNGLAGVQAASDGIVLTGQSTASWHRWLQKIEKPERLNGKTVTISVLFKTMVSGQTRIILYSTSKSKYFTVKNAAFSGVGLLTTTTTIPEGYLESGDDLEIMIYPDDTTYGNTCKAVAAKLELGPTQTLCHKEGDAWVLNQIPDYGEQLSRCQRFFYKTESKTFLPGYVTGGAKTYRSELPIPVPMRTKPAVTGTIPLLTIRTASGGYSSAFGASGTAPGNLSVAFANGATATLEFSVTTAVDANNSVLSYEWWPSIQLSADL